MDKFSLDGNQIDKLKLLNEPTKANQPENGDTPLIAKTAVPVPNSKPQTASISDIVAALETPVTAGVNLESCETSIPEGVSFYQIDGSEVTVYRRKTTVQAQVVGYNVDLKGIVKYMPELEPAVQPVYQKVSSVETEPETINGVNSEIDEQVSQGATGDCWLLTGVLSLSCTEAGRQIIKQSITPNADGSVTVTFKGLGVSYTISADEIKKHDTDNITNDAYSNGDNDMLVLELATELLQKDILSGKVKLNAPEDSFEDYTNKDGIEGGFPSQMVYFLTGKISDTYIGKNIGEPKQIDLTQENIYKILQSALESGNNAISFGIYNGTHTATLINGETYKLALGTGGHALAITNLTQDTVTFVNPWDSTKEYTMTWDEFAKLGIGMLSVTNLDGIEDIAAPNPEDTNTTTYAAYNLKTQGFTDEQISLYFDKNADGSYTMKTDIEFTYYKYSFDNKQSIKISTIEELAKYSGADSRIALKEKGFTDELIDKYFQLKKNAETGISSYCLDLGNYKSYEISPQENGDIVISLPHQNDNSGITRTTIITVKQDGTYFETTRIENSSNQPVYSLAKLKSYGFSEDQINRYFTESQGKYFMRTDIEFTCYPYSFDNKKTIKISTIQELAKYSGADSRAELKEKGLTDELIDKYFELTSNMQTGIGTYALDLSNYIKYEVSTDNNGKTILTLYRTADGNNYTRVTINSDGSYETEVVGDPDAGIKKSTGTIGTLSQLD